MFVISFLFQLKQLGHSIDKVLYLFWVGKFYFQLYTYCMYQVDIGKNGQASPTGKFYFLPRPGWVYCDGRNIYVSGWWISRLFYQKSPWCTFWSRQQRCQGSCLVNNNIFSLLNYCLSYHCIVSCWNACILQFWSWYIWKFRVFKKIWYFVTEEFQLDGFIIC